MLNRFLSEKLRLISFFSMILVVFLHSYNMDKELIYDAKYTKNFVFFVQFFISEGLARVAVPIFFTISGFLFFINKDINFNVYVYLVKKRFKSLVLPYLFWSILGFLIFLLLQVFPKTALFFKQKHFVDYTFNELLDVILINPVPFQFWFIRDLIVFTLFSPIIYIFLKCLKHFGLLILLLAWAIDFDFVIFSNEAILFFVFGSFLGIRKINLEYKLSINYCFFLLTFWISLVFIETMLICNNFTEHIILNIIHKLGILFGVSIIWFIYDFILKNAENVKLKFDSLISLSFFLYATHEPLLEMVKILFYKILGKSQSSLLLIYFISPILVLSISSILGIYLKRKSPVFFGIINGGR